MTDRRCRLQGGLLAWLGLGLGGLGCAEEHHVDPAPPHVLFEGAAWEWEPGHASNDPLASHRPPDATCPEGSWAVEDEVLEIESGLCRYAWFVQELPTSIEAGATLAAEVWHMGLDAAAPGEAHVALLVGEQVLWDATPAIPGGAESWAPEGVLREPVAAGTLIGLHLHNHGDNSWRLGPMTLYVEP